MAQNKKACRYNKLYRALDFPVPLIVKVKIIGNDEVAPGYFVLKVESPDIASLALPGQFSLITCGNVKGTILPRPFSFYKIEGKNIFFLYQVLGRGTALLKTHLTGEKLNILGPLGRGFRFEKNGKKKIIIAGGVGIAPFPFLIREMILSGKVAPKDIILIYGAKRKELLIGLDEFKKIGSLYLSTDNGSEGFKGTSSELLFRLHRDGKLKDGDYFTCGPEKMMRDVVEITRKFDARVQVSLEERMACGVGACLGCVRKIKGQYLCVCKEGPVFWGDEVEW